MCFVDENMSLSAPSDTKKTGTDVSVPPLSQEEAERAFSENYNNTLATFKRVDRGMVDPVLGRQRYCLHSFVPAQGATPDKDGIYGMIKCRGCFEDLETADRRAFQLIRDHDSFNKIFTAHVGQPFPATDSSRFSEDVAEVDVRKKMIEVVSRDIKEKREKEKKEMEEIKNKEKELLAHNKRVVENDGVDPEEQDPMEQYTVLQVKRAQLIWTYVETKKKMEEMKQSILSAREEIEKLDAESPKYKEEYREKYNKAREESGLKADDTSFMKYLGMDKVDELGF